MAQQDQAAAVETPAEVQRMAPLRVPPTIMVRADRQRKAAKGAGSPLERLISRRILRPKWPGATGPVRRAPSPIEEEAMSTARLMNRPRIAIATCVIAALSMAQPSAALARHGQLAARRFANCAALNRVYPHGVGRVRARDHVSGGGAPVTNFKRSNALYYANSGKDRDHDGIACEKH